MFYWFVNNFTPLFRSEVEPYQTHLQLKGANTPLCLKEKAEWLNTVDANNSALLGQLSADRGICPHCVAAAARLNEITNRPDQEAPLVPFSYKVMERLTELTQRPGYKVTSLVAFSSQTLTGTNNPFRTVLS